MPAPQILVHAKGCARRGSCMRLGPRVPNIDHAIKHTDSTKPRPLLGALRAYQGGCRPAPWTLASRQGSRTHPGPHAQGACLGPCVPRATCTMVHAHLGAHAPKSVHILGSRTREHACHRACVPCNDALES